MDLLPQLLAVLSLLPLLILHNQLTKRIQNRRQIIKSPPEPPGSWPIIGHLHLLTGKTIPAARILGSLADNHGPVFTLRLGLQPAVVVSSREAVKQCFTKNDKVFANRPDSNAGKHFGFDYAAFGFTNGQYWRQMRKLVMVELVSGPRLEMLGPIRISEIDTSIKELYKVIRDNPGGIVVMSRWIEQLTSNIIVMMVAGKRYANDIHGAETAEARSYGRVMKESMNLVGRFVLSDAIPSRVLTWLDFDGAIRSMKRVAKELRNIAESWIDERIQEDQKNEKEFKCFIDVMLSKIDDEFPKYGRTRESIIIGTIMNLIFAGSDTTSTLLTWLLSLLLNNRRVLDRAREEIDSKVGKKRWVEDSDIKNLLYLQAIVKETLRLYPSGPLSVPHEATEDCYVNGYLIPKGTSLWTNIWKLHRDPSIWSDPEKFMPERFLTSHAEVDFIGQDFEFIPFGSGRRSCPGITFATQVTHLTLARLLQGFDFRTPSDTLVDMTEGQGLILHKANPLEVLVMPRLPDVLYQNH